MGGNASVKPDAGLLTPLSKNPLAGGSRNRRFCLEFCHAITVCLKTIVCSQGDAMPWRDLLSATQRAQVMALPTSLREYEELYTLTPADQEFVAAHRTGANRLGVAVQLCFLRYPGRASFDVSSMPRSIWHIGRRFLTTSSCAWTASLRPKNCRRPRCSTACSKSLRSTIRSRAKQNC